MTFFAPLSSLPVSVDSAAVELVDVVKRYGGHRALDGLSLSLAPGELVALLGPSGCGKTTALRTLAGLEDVQGGVIRIAGEDVTHVPTSRRDIGMVFQAYSLFPHLTAQENVEFGLRMRKVARFERRMRAAEALELVGLVHKAGSYAHELSGGQQQRIALARALVTSPRVLLLDEPLSALDAKVRVTLREEIRRIQTELGITTVFVTHDQEEALAVADRVAVMNAGAIEQVGSPEELYRRPASAFVADFVGVSSRLPGVLTGDVVEVFGMRIPVLPDAQADGPVVVAVRPEDVLITSADRGAGVRARVVTTSFLGSLRRTRVQVGEVVVAVQHAPDEAFAPGDEVRVVLRANPVRILAPR